MLNKENLREKIMKKISDDSFIDRFDIQVSIEDDGTVTLSGSIDNYAQKKQAEDIVAKIDEVERVNNHLVVGDSPTPSPNEMSEEAQLSGDQRREMREFVEESVSDALKIDPSTMRVTVDAYGVMDIAGWVPADWHKEELENLVWSRTGVSYVINRLEAGEDEGRLVKEPSPMHKALAAAKFKYALIADELVSRPLSLGVRVEGDLAVVEGEVDNGQAKDRVLQYAKEYYPEFKVVDQLNVAQE